MRVLQRGLLVSLVALASRVLGLLREIVIVRLFGVNAATDVFYALFRVPNLLRQLLAEGALSQALLPWLQTTDADPLRRAALRRHWLRVALGTLLLTLLLGLATAALWMKLVLPTPTPPELATLGMTFWLACLPYVAAAGLCGVLTTLLQAQGHWVSATAAPLGLSLSLILLPLLLPADLHPGIAVLGWAILLGGALQLLWLVMAVRRARIVLRGAPCRVDPSPWWRQVGPALLGVATVQLLGLIDTWFAARLSEGAVSWLYLADRIAQFPVGLLGAAISLVGLDHLLRTAPAQAATQHRALLRLSLGAGTLAALAAGVAAPLLVATLYGPGHTQASFEPEDAAHTIACLQVFACGLPAVLLLRACAAILLAAGQARWLAGSALTCLLLDILLQSLWQAAGLATPTRVAATGVCVIWCFAALAWTGIRSRLPGADLVWTLRLLTTALGVTGLAAALKPLGVGVPSGAFWTDALHLLALLGGLLVAGAGLGLVVGLRPLQFRTDPA